MSLTADGFDIDSTTSWQLVPGWVLLALLLVTFSGLTLISNDCPSYYDRLIRISPLTSLYDFFHRAAEIGFLTYERHMGGDGDEGDDVDIFVRLDGISNYTTLMSHLTALASFLALLSFRNATGTQLIAAVYFIRWLTRCVVPMLPAHMQHPDRTDTIHRTSAAFFVMFWNWLLYLTMIPEECRTAKTESTSTGVTFLSTGLAYLLASPTEQDNHSGLALGMQACSVCFLSLAWLFVLSPVAKLRAPLTQQTPEADVLERWSFPAMWMSLGVLSFLMSRHSLDMAHKGVKVGVAGMWGGLMAFYYCYWYGFLYWANDTAVAMRPNAIAMFWRWILEEQHGV